MPIIAKINRESTFKAKVNKTGTMLNPVELTVKNQFREYQINSIQDLPDVNEISIVEGATLVFNSSTSNYEVKPLDGGYISGTIDGGEF